MNKLILLLLLGVFVITFNAQTQPTPQPVSPSGIKTNLAAGEVSTINQAEKKLSLQTSDGAIEVLIIETTGFKRVLPEKPAITSAVDSSLSEIGEKDKVLVTGTVSNDKKTITAKNIYLMSKSDIAKKLAAESALWKTRGISGRVVKVDFKTKEVTITNKTMMVETEVVLSPKENAEFLRYAPESAKFSDALSSNLAEIKVGDQLKALGDKSADGLSFKAEKFVTGSFKTVAGKITSIDVEKNEITIEDNQNKKPTVIVVNKDSILKRFPTEMAQGLARMMGGGMQPPQGEAGGNTTFVMRPAQGGQPTSPTNQPKPTENNGTQTNQTRERPSNPNGENPNAGGQRQMGFNRGGARGTDLEDILERIPAITIAELKVGDTIGVASTVGAIPDRYTAFKLVSGVEPFLTIPRITAGGRPDQQPTINIPGLDGGFGTP